MKKYVILAAFLTACGQESVTIIKGIDGVNGVDGTSGVDGLKGDTGAAGLNGSNGLDGKDGQDGVDGVNGVNGINGLNGQDGADGVDGVNGTNGLNGAAGATGATGATGPAGAATLISVTDYAPTGLDCLLIIDSNPVRYVQKSSNKYKLYSSQNCSGSHTNEISEGEAYPVALNLIAVWANNVLRVLEF